jgi:NAD(P)H dehydrogenase (quinone)
MAQAVVTGAQRITSVATIIKTPDKVTDTDLKTADAILLGSPTYFGDMAEPMKAFIDDWWLKYHTSLINKVGGAFSTGAGETGGKEHVLYSFIIAMMNAGMIIVGPLEGSSFGTAGVTALDPVNENALNEASAFGERAARIAQQLKAGL